MNVGGRPKKYETPEQMQVLIDKYFKECDEQDEPYTVTGLALALDLDRKSIINYSKDDMFFHTIKNAKLKIENYLGKNLLKNSAVTGTIFNLKNNYGWKDNQDVNANLNSEIKVTLSD